MEIEASGAIVMLIAAYLIGYEGAASFIEVLYSKGNYYD